MRIKLDENLPATAAAHLRSLGHDVHTVPDEGLGGALDDLIFQAAQHEDRFLVTQDLDFSDARKYGPGQHHGILLLRLTNPTRRALQEHLLALFRRELVESWSRCLVVTTETKIRIRRP